MIANLSDGEWEDILIKLRAFTWSFLKGKKWFRGINASTFVSGKEVKDYVYEALGKYIENPGKFNPEKGELVDYLKFNIIRTLVGNDARKLENQFTTLTIDNDTNDDNDTYLNRITPLTEALFVDDIDYKKIKEFIEKELTSDNDAENIFLGIYSYGLKRNEIIQEFQMLPQDYDNAMRRLKTVISRARENFNPNKQIV